MKKLAVRVVKKDTLNSKTPTAPKNSRNEFSRSIAHKISGNVMNWVDEMRERKVIETAHSFSLLAKVSG